MPKVTGLVIPVPDELFLKFCNCLLCGVEPGPNDVLLPLPELRFINYEPQILGYRLCQKCAGASHGEVSNALTALYEELSAIKV